MRRSASMLLPPRIVDSLAITAITGYQRYLSPYKGFRCAHRVLHRGESCSQYVKRVVREEGLGVALQKSRVRFVECKEANYLLQARRKNRLSIESGESEVNQEPESNDTEQSPSPAKQRRKFGSNSNSSCDNSDCLNCEDCCYVPDCSGCDTTGLDCSGCDASCGDMSNCGDCGDCSGCGDCGSCSN